jgi:predicted secreted protein
MKGSGASPEAIAFSRDMGNEAWLRAFRESGRVDIAYVTYPFRANENQGILLVNGDPSPVDVDGSAVPSRGALEKDLVFEALAKRYPDISLWPGDRFGTDQPVAEQLPGGGTRFHVGYLLRNGCHACEEIGSAVFAFDFDSGGRFTGTKLMMVTDATGKGFSDPGKPIAVEVGKEFSLVLASNPTTGYGWSLASDPDEKVIIPAGSGYRPSASGLMGAGGAETWTFKAVGKGRTVIVLRYSRPWEKGVEPVREAAFVVIVR